MILALSLSLIALIAQDPTAQDPVDQDPAPGKKLAQNEVEITYLANEGFLLRSGRFKILIDAFVGEPYSGYEALPPEMLEKLVNAEPPFDGRSIMILTSHIHKDHFQPKYVEQFMLNSKGPAFLSSKQVVNTLTRNAENPGKIKSLCGAIPVKPGRSQKIPRKEVALTFMNIPHGGEQNENITNYGHLVRMADQRILHIGDAEAKVENFAPFNLAEKNIDIAFVPYWYFTSEEGLEIIDKHFNANYLIACHFPKDDKRRLVEQLHEENPHVLVFEKSGDKKVFQSAKKE